MKNVVADFSGYYTYETMTVKLLQWNVTYQSMFRMFSLGTSPDGRHLWAVEVSTTPGDQSTMKPNVKYIGNMHGDEVVGRELLMRFLERLLTDTSAEVSEYVSTTNTFVVPTMNPDGFVRGVRGNRNNVDLNRNFPDQYRPTGPEQRETQLIKAFIASRQWTLSANFHGGDLVANYPWDGRADAIYSRENKSPDDDTFRILAKTYARSNDGMMTNTQFSEGITNGAAWYVLFGGMQDFNYIHHGCPEITLEVSMSKWPPGSQLDVFWNQNKQSMLNYLKLAHTGVRGIVYDAASRVPIEGVSVTVVGREITQVKTRRENGAYFRILPRGTWQLRYSAPGYMDTLVTVIVPPPSMGSGAAGEPTFTSQNVFLVRSIATPSSPPPVTSTPQAATPMILSPSGPNPSSTSPKPKMKALISTSESWIIPFFAILGCFAAIVVITIAFVILQGYGVNITGGAAVSTASLPTIHGQLQS